MHLRVIHDEGTVHTYKIDKETFYDPTLSGHLGYIGTHSKESNACNIFKAYFSNAKAILLDESNKIILAQVQSYGIVPFGSVAKKTKTIFDGKDFSFVYFTSGSTGVPVAALKTVENLQQEIESLKTVFQDYDIRKVLVTVPFIHLYGTLLGLFYPMMNNIDIVLKEHFLPQDLLAMIDEHTMVVTTPLYIKSLNKLALSKDLKGALFVSSTAALDVENIALFQKKFNADIIQIFGSTETGGIAHKKNRDTLWHPFDSVSVTTNAQSELKVTSPFVSSVLYEKTFMYTEGRVQTFDYIEQETSGFRLLGRSSKIIKLAGKRYSTIQIEQILEKVEGIRKALVFTEIDKESLRGEYLDISIESDQVFLSKEIKSILQKQLSNLKFSIRLNIVKEIPINQIGKKLRIK